MNYIVDFRWTLAEAIAKKCNWHNIPRGDRKAAREDLVMQIKILRDLNEVKVNATGVTSARLNMKTVVLVPYLRGVREVSLAQPPGIVSRANKK